MLSLEKVLKEILPIYSRYMVCYTLDEQETIIHEFLNQIEQNETIKYLKDKCSKCQECKFTTENMELYKLDLPNEVVKNICAMNYDRCCKCHHSTKFIKMIEERFNGKYNKPVGWKLFGLYYEFPDLEDFKRQFPKYNYGVMERIYSYMTVGKSKTKKEVKNIIERACTSNFIRKYTVSSKIKQFNKVMKWVYEMGLSTIHPLNFYPELEV